MPHLLRISRLFANFFKVFQWIDKVLLLPICVEEHWLGWVTFNQAWTCQYFCRGKKSPLLQFLQNGDSAHVVAPMKKVSEWTHLLLLSIVSSTDDCELLQMAVSMASFWQQLVLLSFHFPLHWHFLCSLLQVDYSYAISSEQCHLDRVLCFVLCQSDRIIKKKILLYQKFCMLWKKNQGLLIRQKIKI